MQHGVISIATVLYEGVYLCTVLSIQKKFAEQHTYSV